MPILALFDNTMKWDQFFHILLSEHNKTWQMPHRALATDKIIVKFKGIKFSSFFWSKDYKNVLRGKKLSSHLGIYFWIEVSTVFWPSLFAVLLLTSDNFRSILPSTLPSSFSFVSWLLLKLSSGTIFTVCSHTFILFWLRKASVSVEMYQSSLHILFWFICAFYLQTSSFFR